MTTIVERINPKTAPPNYAGRKRPQALALAVYDPAAAAHPEHAKRTKPLNISVNAGALVPFMAPPPIPAAPNRTEPSWLRMKLLLGMGFRTDMEVYFIDEKAVTATDLDAQQNRFRLPTDGVRHLREMLSGDELKAADLLHEKAPRQRPPKQPPAQEEQGGKRKRNKGKKHVGLPVVVVNKSGTTKELKLTQWESSRGTVINGDGYVEFIRQCKFEPDEVVEIWAFREKRFRFFGVNMCVESPLHVLIASKEKKQVAA